jgi:hypothetical protein
MGKVRLGSQLDAVDDQIATPGEANCSKEVGMTPPSVGGFVTVQDNGTIEFDLHLQRA